MTVRELIGMCPCDIWITLNEDPTDEPPVCIIKNGCYDDFEFCLSDKVLDHEIYLIIGKEDVVYVSLFIANDDKTDECDDESEALF